MTIEELKQWYLGKIRGFLECSQHDFHLYIPKMIVEADIIIYTQGSDWNFSLFHNGDYWAKDWICAYFYKNHYNPPNIHQLTPSMGIVCSFQADDTLQPGKGRNIFKAKGFEYSIYTLLDANVVKGVALSLVGDLSRPIGILNAKQRFESFLKQIGAKNPDRLINVSSYSLAKEMLLRGDSEQSVLEYFNV